MVNIFNFSKNYFVGIDFGTSAIKVVELSYKNHKVHLVNYGWASLEITPGSEPPEQRVLTHDDKLKLYLQNLIDRMKLKSDSAYVSVPAFVGLFVLVEFPDMENSELEKAVHFEARKYIPNNLEEFSIGWEVVAKSDRSGILTSEKSPGKVQVLMVVAPRKEIERCGNIVSSTRLEIKALELETFSLVRSLVGDDPNTFIIIDIGSRITNIVLAEKGIIKINRSINVGGTEITNSIAESLNISKQSAEMMKKESRDILNSREAGMVMPPLEMIVGEVNRVVSSYRAKNPKGSISSVILSGGSAKMTGMEEFFSKRLGIPAAQGRPWQKIMVNEKIMPAVEKIGTSFSVAIGLALRGVEEYQRK